VLAAAAAILVFVGVGLRPPGERVGSVAKAGVRQQARVRSVPFEVEGPRTETYLQKVGGMAPPSLHNPTSRLIGGRYLPGGVNGHDAQLLAWEITLRGEPVVLSVLEIAGVRAEEMSDGEEVSVNGRTLHVVQTDGHTAVTVVDMNHIGYMFMAEELPVDDLV